MKSLAFSRIYRKPHKKLKYLHIALQNFDRSILSVRYWEFGIGCMRAHSVFK